MDEALTDKWTVTPSGCWEWRRARLEGYGIVYSREAGKNVRAHRYVYEMHHGPIPDGLTIDHLCRNRACVNPDHLEAVTKRVNTLRGETVTGDNARKTVCLRGHPFSPENTYARNGRRHCRTCRRLTKACKRR